MKSKQRFGSWVSFWSNRIADLSLFAGNGDPAKGGTLPLTRFPDGRDYTLQHQERLSNAGEFAEPFPPQKILARI